MQHQSKEMSGNKMVKIIIGTIIVASVLIVITIQSFYALWEPKQRNEIEKDEQPSLTKPAMLYEHLLIELV